MLNQLKYYLTLPLLARKQFRAEEALILCSEARGGSTWLMEMLNTSSNILPSWEPLHQKYGVVPEEFGWSMRPFIPKDNDDPRYEKVIRDILTCKRASEWTLKHASPTDAWQAQFVLTKFVRAIPILPWLLQRFSFRRPPILLMRHPLDTCTSMLRAFPFNQDERGQVPIPKRLSYRYSEAELQFARQLKTPLERQVAIWCLDNLPTLRHPDVRPQVQLVFYEELVRQPEQVLRGVLRQWDMEGTASKLLPKIAFRKPSHTDFKGHLSTSPEDQLWKNLKQLAPPQRRALQRIFDHYGLEIYNMESPFPQKAAWS